MLTHEGFLVEEGGFEPPKSSTTDLQSAPFGHSGTPPYLIGAGGRTRTPDLLITNQLLYQLSYTSESRAGRSQRSLLYQTFCEMSTPFLKKRRNFSETLFIPFSGHPAGPSCLFLRPMRAGTIYLRSPGGGWPVRCLPGGNTKERKM